MWRASQVLNMHVNTHKYAVSQKNIPNIFDCNLKNDRINGFQ